MEHEKEHAIAETGKIKKKMRNERKHGKNVILLGLDAKSFCIRFFLFVFCWDYL